MSNAKVTVKTIVIVNQNEKMATTIHEREFSTSEGAGAYMKVQKLALELLDVLTKGYE